MSVSTLNTNDLIRVPGAWGWTIAGAGLLAVFATYWDESWHTDIGRDSAWTAPHVLLYGAFGVVGISVAAWGLTVLRTTRSLPATLRQPGLLAAGLGGTGALAAAPIDAAWHSAYGRDSVLFSPPHMLIVLASTALVLGVLSSLPARARAVRTAMGVLFLANAAAVVFEYEADVPQFSEVLYLPLLLATGLASVAVIRATVPVRLPVTVVVVGYVVVRVAIDGALIVVGRSAPDLPIAVLGLAAVDLPLRHLTSRIAAAAAATSALAWGASAVGWASPPPSDVGVVAAPAIVLSLLVIVARGQHRLRAAPLLALVVVAGFTLATPQPAQAHDPGQGEVVTQLDLSARTDHGNQVVFTATFPHECEQFDARSVVARRAGQEIATALKPVGDCVYQGSLSLPESGRWFVYATFTQTGAPVEAWLPVPVGTTGTLTETRELYRPAGQTGDIPVTQIVFGALIYLLGIGLLALGIRATMYRRPGYSVAIHVPSQHGA